MAVGEVSVLVWTSSFQSQKTFIRAALFTVYPNSSVHKRLVSVGRNCSNSDLSNIFVEGYFNIGLL